MISSIGSNHAAHAHRGHASSLTAHQRADLTSLLSQYDPNSLSSDDAKAIVSQIKEFGIKPGKELGETLKAAGFNPGELREAAGSERRAPPPRRDQGSGQIDQAAIEALTSILENVDLNRLSSDDQQGIQSQLSEAGFSFGSSGQVLDVRL